jgi:hypothetical protein
MATLDDVKKGMRATGNFGADEIDALTQQSIDDAERNAEDLPTGSYPADAKPLGTTWTGNNFRIVSGVWYWDDTPGSMCGRTRTWKYTPRPGASYRQAGKCPQGYPWYEMYIPA